MESEQNTQPVPQSTPQEDNTLLMAVFAYLSILVLIPLLTVRNNSFVQFHVRQGLILLIIEVIAMLIGSMLFLYQIAFIINFGAAILSIIGIVNVTQRKETELPLVGQYAKHINI